MIKRAVLSTALAASAVSPAVAAERGLASVYGPSSGKKVACGGKLSATALTAAHRTLPCGTKVRVRASNGRSVAVIINDKGPWISGRIIDLAPASAAALGLTANRGIMPVIVERVE